LFRADVIEILGDEQLGFGFDQRSAGTAQKEMKFLRGIASLPFGDVGWNEYSCFSQLTGEGVDLVAWKSPGYRVNFHHKIHGFLPGNQFSIGLSHDSLQAQS
jgi:hypothetical protein